VPLSHLAERARACPNQQQTLSYLARQEDETRRLDLRGRRRLAVTITVCLLLPVSASFLTFRQHLLPQRFGISGFRSGQRARRRPMTTWQLVKEGAQALHGQSVHTRSRSERPGRALGIDGHLED